MQLLDWLFLLMAARSGKAKCFCAVSSLKMETTMFISDRLQNRLNSCRRAALKNPIQSFLRTWSSDNITPAHYYNQLHALCKAFDEIGEYHDAEEIMIAGQIILENEPRRRELARQTRLQRAREGRTLLKVGGLVVGGLLLCSLLRKTA